MKDMDRYMVVINGDKGRDEFGFRQYDIFDLTTNKFLERDNTLPIYANRTTTLDGVAKRLNFEHSEYLISIIRYCGCALSPI